MIHYSSALGNKKRRWEKLNKWPLSGSITASIRRTKAWKSQPYIPRPVHSSSKGGLKMPSARDRHAVVWSESDDVLHVELCAPPINNLDAELVKSISVALDAFENSPARVLLLSSRVARYFATSGAPSEASATTKPLEHAAMALHEVCDRLTNSAHPSIAVVDGFALDAGLKLAMACTARVGSATARMGMPRYKLNPITGEKAREIGLLDKFAETGNLNYEAFKLATALTSPIGPTTMEILRRVDEVFPPSPTFQDNSNHSNPETMGLLEGLGARARLRKFLRLD